MDLLWSDMSIRKGESTIIVDLLLQIRKVRAAHICPYACMRVAADPLPSPRRRCALVT